MLRVSNTRALRGIMYISKRSVLEGGFKPGWIGRIKYRIFSMLRTEIRDDGLMEDADLPKKNKRIEEETKTPKTELPKLDGLDVRSLLNYYESTLQEKLSNGLMLHIYHTINSKLPSFMKDEVLRFLQLSIQHKPKEMSEKEITLEKERQIFDPGKPFLSPRHMQIAKKHSHYMDLSFLLFHHYYQHMRKGMLRNLVKQEADIDYMEVSSSDILPSYSLIFQNIEKIINHYWNSDRDCFNTKDLISILASFSTAQEGTDYFYETLGEFLFTKISEMDLFDVDIFLNSFPHEIWQTSDLLAEKPELLKSSYHSLYLTFRKDISKLPKELFYSLFQGIVSVNPVIYQSRETVDSFLHNFMRILGQNEANKGEVLKFIELLSIYIASNKMNNVPQLDVNTIAEYFYLLYLSRMDLGKFELSELTAILWSFHRMDAPIKKYFNEVIEKAIKKAKEINIDTCDYVVLTALMEDSKLLKDIVEKASPGHTRFLDGVIKDISKQVLVKDYQ